MDSRLGTLVFRGGVPERDGSGRTVRPEVPGLGAPRVDEHYDHVRDRTSYVDGFLERNNGRCPTKWEGHLGTEDGVIMKDAF